MTHSEALQLLNSLSGVEAFAPIPDDVKETIKRLYRYATGERLKQCNCPDVYSDALLIIKLKFRKMEKSQKYILKRGVVIQTADSSEVYTRENITDEVAKAYLEKFPNKVSVFESIPEDVEQATEEVEQYTEEVEKPKAKKIA